MSNTDDKNNLKPDNIYFIPLGGSEQFGVNLNLYAYQDSFLAIDCGIGFADHRFPGIDLLLPDPEYIEEQNDKLVGLIITHAHEDHVGAVPYLWPRLRCPIYCTEFTAEVLKRKFDEHPRCKDAEIIVVPPEATIDIGPFNVHFIPVAHSIPDTSALVIKTDVGNIIHSGDWNLDPTPAVGAKTEAKNFKAYEGALAYIGDSTNSNVEGRSVSEMDVEAGLAEVFKDCKKRIAVTIFSSNVGRIRSICKAAAANDRSVCLIGRSLHNMAGIAIKCGYLNDVADFVSEEDLSYLPEENQVLVLTGSQGESRAALARIARGDHREIKFARGDTVIFSSRAIPGNEAEINHVKNNLVATGVRIIAPDDTKHCIHVSGHPRRDEVAEMYQWVKPQTVVPVHGERQQLEAQADLARACQIQNVIVPNNGSVICLGPDTPEIIDHVETGLVAVDPKRLLKADHRSIVERRKLQFSGMAHVSIVVDARGELLADPVLTTEGVLDMDNKDDLAFEDHLHAEIEDIFVDMTRQDKLGDHFIAEEVRIGVRRFVYNALGIKPKTTVHVIRL